MTYLKESVLKEKSLRLMETVANQTDVYIFSGIIRNFLLGYEYNRDVDVVITNIKSIQIPSDLFAGCSVKKNSFGGFKLGIDNLTVDAWGIESTWGLLHKNMRFTPSSLIKTAFFNFSSIVFHYNKKKFYYDKVFCKFLHTKAVDVVFPENPNKALCILNTIYYAKNYKFPIAFSLCKWILNNYDENLPFSQTQYSHFSNVVVNDEQRIWFYETLKYMVKGRYLKKNQALYLDFVQRIVSVVDV